jgi:hypothetical protein
LAPKLRHSIMRAKDAHASKKGLNNDLKNPQNAKAIQPQG